MYIRRIFFKIDATSPLNVEAGDLYAHNMEGFRTQVVETVRQSKDVLYNPIESRDAHMIRLVT